MKALLTIFILLSSFWLSAQDTKASSKDYENLASDMCACVNKNSSALPTEMKEIYIKYADSSDVMISKLSDYYANHIDEVSKNLEMMDKMGTDIDLCMEDLEKKYASLYADESQENIEAVLMEILRTKSGCELTYALLKIVESTESEDYYDDEGE